MNPFEALHRERKVARMLGELPPVRSDRETTAQAAVLAAWSQVQRNCWASHCGVTAPSETTWTLLVEAARARRLAERRTA